MSAQQYPIHLHGVTLGYSITRRSRFHPRGTRPLFAYERRRADERERARERREEASDHALRDMFGDDFVDGVDAYDRGALAFFDWSEGRQS